MLALKNLLVMPDFASIDRVAQDLVKMSTTEQDATLLFARFGNPLLCAQIRSLSLFFHFKNRSMFKVEIIDNPNRFRLLRVNCQRLPSGS